MEGNNERPYEEKNVEHFSEVSDEKIIQKNLDLMKTEMLQVIINESMGANAGSVTIEGTKYPCAGANGYADSDTGEVVAFGNIQDLPDNITKEYQPFRLKVMVGKDFYRIIDIDGINYFGKQARTVLKKSGGLFNSSYRN
jgi:hypothetical protein